MPRAAICISGHLRSFRETYTDIYNQFLSVLEKEGGYELHYFVSTWDTAGFRENGNWQGDIQPELNFCNSQFKARCILVEPFARDEFIEKYSHSTAWMNYSHLANNTTLGDAVSMWYKAYTCLKMIDRTGEKFDLVVRLRPDTIFDDPITGEDIARAMRGIAIPEWHGKMREISDTMVDYFAMGTYPCMREYLSVYADLDSLIFGGGAVIHTGEGLLLGQLPKITRYGELSRLYETGFSLKRHSCALKIVDSIWTYLRDLGYSRDCVDIPKFRDVYDLSKKSKRILLISFGENGSTCTGSYLHLLIHVMLKANPDCTVDVLTVPAIDFPNDRIRKVSKESLLTGPDCIYDYIHFCNEKYLHKYIFAKKQATLLLENTTNSYRDIITLWLGLVCGKYVSQKYSRGPDYSIGIIEIATQMIMY